MGIAEQDWDRILDVNLLGTVYCAQAAARHMMRQRSGRIVNIASVAGAIPRINGAAYGVSKAGVRMFTKCLALELARHGITVNAVAPGRSIPPCWGPRTISRSARASWRARPNSSASGVPLGKLGKPEDVASAIVYLASEEAHHITGAILNVDGMAQLSLEDVGGSGSDPGFRGSTNAGRLGGPFGGPPSHSARGREARWRVTTGRY